MTCLFNHDMMIPDRTVTNVMIKLNTNDTNYR